jgi:hypothetical protein
MREEEPEEGVRLIGGEMREGEPTKASPADNKKAETTAAAPDMKSVVEEAVAAALGVLVARRDGMSFSSYSERTKATVELAGRLLQWDAARMALEAARLRGKAPGAGGRSDGQAS